MLVKDETSTLTVQHNGFGIFTACKEQMCAEVTTLNHKSTFHKKILKLCNQRVSVQEIQIRQECFMYRWNTNSHLSVKEESQRGEYATYIVTCLSLTYRSWVPTWPPSEFLLEFYRELAAISLPPFSSVLIHHFLVEVHCECKDYSYWKAEYKKIDEGKKLKW